MLSRNAFCILDYIAHPRQTRLPPPPLHPLHQRPGPIAPSPFRTLIFLLLQQRRMPLRTDPSRLPGAHRVLAGVLPPRAFRTLPRPYTWTARDASGEMACDAENVQGEGSGWRGRAHGGRGMGEDMEASSREQRSALRIRRTPVRSLCFSLPFMPQPILENRTFIQLSLSQTTPPWSQ